MRDTHHVEGLSWAFAGVLLFSFTAPLTRIALRGFDPYLTATGRALIAGLLGAGFLAVRHVPFPQRPYLRPLLITTVGAVFGWPILLALALQRTTAAHVAVIAAFMPVSTALIAVVRTHERVSRQFWAAAIAGTVVLLLFALTRGGAQDADLVADALIAAATLFSSWCYVEGASITRAMPGWQVISWVVVLALPITAPASAVLWWTTRADHDTTPGQWTSLLLLGLSSMYVGFFAWYRGLALAGTARGGQVQQLQALLTIGWSALLLGEHVGAATILAALAVIGSVVWAQRGRVPTVAAPQE